MRVGINSDFTLLSITHFRYPLNLYVKSVLSTAAVRRRAKYNFYSFTFCQSALSTLVQIDFTLKNRVKHANGAIEMKSNCWKGLTAIIIISNWRNDRVGPTGPMSVRFGPPGPGHKLPSPEASQSTAAVTGLWDLADGSDWRPSWSFAWGKIRNLGWTSTWHKQSALLSVRSWIVF